MGRKKKIYRRSLIGVEVIDSFAYIDSVFLLLPRLLPPELFAKLQHAQKGHHSDSPYGIEVHSWPRPEDPGGFQLVLTVHQPSPESLKLLQEAIELPNKTTVLEVHIALDLTTKTRSDANQLQRYVEEHLLPTIRPKNPTRVKQGTTYYNRLTRKGHEITLYSDKGSKVNKAPCLHIEWRTIGLQVIRAAKLSKPSRLVSLDYRAFWDSRLRMRKAPSKEKLVAARTKKSKKDNATVEASTAEISAHIDAIFNGAEGSHGGTVAHDLIFSLYADNRYHARPSRLFTPEPHSWMLPTSRNSLWLHEGRYPSHSI